MITIDGALLAAGGPYGLVVALQKLTKTQGWLLMPFLSGAATAFVALLIEMFLSDYSSLFASANYILGIKAFGLVALPEELVKTALIYAAVMDRPDARFTTVAIFAAAIGAGFAATENLLYLSHIGVGAIVGRLLTATPFHTFLAIVSAKLIFAGSQRKQTGFIYLALLVGTLLHGSYDYLILSDHGRSGKFVFALALTSSLAISLLRGGKDSK